MFVSLHTRLPRVLERRIEMVNHYVVDEYSQVFYPYAIDLFNIFVDMTFSGEECRLQTCRRLASQLFDSTLSTLHYADLTYAARNRSERTMPLEWRDWKMI
mmetsp:Transcript_51032/g.123072  ORF Transcript_51032/g.123072 Transcript_51032/m.123072 type:complete len:101 (+) Transcript_51032:2976-3278(+)